MRRRLLIAKALVHQPPVLVLDEPTAGVDVDLRRQLWELVEEMNAEGVTVVLTTHYLEEAEALCERIAIINHGQLIANKPTRELVEMAREKIVVLTLDRDIAAPPGHPAFLKCAKAGERVLEVTYDKDRHQCRGSHGADPGPGLCDCRCDDARGRSGGCFRHAD